MPHIGLHDVDEVGFGGVRLVNIDREPSVIEDSHARERVRAILRMHRDSARDPGKARSLSDIGVFVTDRRLEPLDERTFRRVQELRHALFLSCLARNVQLQGPNAGHMIYTAENFDLVRQNFTLESDHVAETTGVLVRRTIAGYRLGETTFPRPAYVNMPRRFQYDERMLWALGWLRRRVPKLYRRIMRAAAVFIESYYNAPSVDIRARVLLQAAAFEVLLDLPEREQRKAFKIEIESLMNEPGDKQYHYKYEVPGGSRDDRRSLKGIWADRFYTLRNHIVHGDVVRSAEYTFRRTQHHLVLAPMFFVLAAKKLIDRERQGRGESRVFFERLTYRFGTTDDESDLPATGRVFRVETDFGALFIAGGHV